MIPSKDAVLSRLPAYMGNLEIYADDQGTRDIITAIIRVHNQEKGNYDRICDLFDGGSGEEIGERCFDFLRENSRYVPEDENLQTVRSAAGIVATGKGLGLDCKNYSSFCAGIISGLNRKGAGIPWAYRFAAYDHFGIPNRKLKHVFVVLYPGEASEIWIDPVLSYFDSREKIPCYYQDKTPQNMALGKLSGLGRARIGQDGTDFSTGDYIDPSVAYYDPSMDTGGTSSPPNISYTPAGSDLIPASTFDPATAQAATPDVLSTGIQQTDSGSYSIDYGALSPDSSLINQPTPSSPSFFDSLMNNILGKGSGSAAGGGASAGTSSQKQSSPQQKQQQQQVPGTNIYLQTPQAPAGSSNTLLYIGLAAAAGLGLYLLTRKR